jgi:signal transduction histidine kinase
VFRARSVVSRVVALHLIAIVVTSICMPLALYAMLKYAAQQLHDRALREQAAEILRYIDLAPNGSPRLSLPGPLAELYSEAYGRYAFAVLDESDHVLFSSLSSKQAIAPAGPRREPFSSFTRRRDGADIYGVGVAADLDDRHLLIQVSQDLAHRDVLIDDIVADFFPRVGWITAPILLLLLVIDVAIFRRALKPIVAASALAERIGPSRTELRLPEAGMPREVLPLIHAVNLALDRLEEGFRGQREFTADAAHELRTPLSILRTQIDMIAHRELQQSLRDDVEGMSRLVNQLLEIAELETFMIGEHETADLTAAAAEVAAFIAPLALSQEKTVAVSGAQGPVPVRGNADTIGRAIRNLVENGLAHTPAGTMVEIAVDPAGILRVVDNGPGVPAAEREHIFRRFWRRDRRRPGSAGLGLSIVARIAEMHGAEVGVEDAPGGGAVFAIRFPAVPTEAPANRDASSVPDYQPHPAAAGSA